MCGDRSFASMPGKANIASVLEGVPAAPFLVALYIVYLYS